MEITSLVLVVIGLIIVLGILMFFLFSARAKAKKNKQRIFEAKVKKSDFNTLLAVIQSQKSNSQELKEALDLVLKDYGEIDNLESYMNILFAICLHPNTNKNIILSFNKELVRLNPKYKVEINGAISKGLNSRGV